MCSYLLTHSCFTQLTSAGCCVCDIINIVAVRDVEELPVVDKLYIINTRTVTEGCFFFTLTFFITILVCSQALTIGKLFLIKYCDCFIDLFRPIHCFFPSVLLFQPFLSFVCYPHFYLFPESSLREAWEYKEILILAQSD